MRNGILIGILSLLVTTMAFAQTDPNAKIDLALVPSVEQVELDQTFEVSLLMSAQTTPQRFIVCDIIFGWDPSVVEFLGITHEGSHPLIMLPTSGLPCPEGMVGCSGFPDFYGINEAMPPADGTGLYFGYGKLGQVLMVEDEPVQIVKFIFKVVAPFDETAITLIPSLTIDYPEDTVVYGGYIGGNVVTGTLTNAVVRSSLPLVGDFDGSGSVDSGDLGMLLANWGVVSFDVNPYDLSGNGVVDGADLVILISNWN